jgi:hypothetical protein
MVQVSGNENTGPSTAWRPRRAAPLPVRQWGSAYSSSIGSSYGPRVIGTGWIRRVRLSWRGVCGFGCGVHHCTKDCAARYNDKGQGVSDGATEGASLVTGYSGSRGIRLRVLHLNGAAGGEDRIHRDTPCHVPIADATPPGADCRPSASAPPRPHHRLPIPARAHRARTIARIPAWCARDLPCRSVP